MNFGDSSRNSSIILNSGSLSRHDVKFKATVPNFTHHTTDLSKKSFSTKIYKTTKNPDQNSSHDLSKINSISLSNLSFLNSARNPRYARPYRSKEVAPKVLNMSHDADLPNPGPYTEGNSSVMGHNHSRHEARRMTLPCLEDGEIGVSPISRRTQRNVENGADSSRFYFFNQQNASQNRVGPPNNVIATTQDNHRTQPIVIDPEAPIPTIEDQEKTIQHNNPVEQIQEITAEHAENWQHDLTVKANHKFRVVQWSLIFIILASLMAYASISGETPANVLYIILLLNNILHIYSLVRFFSRNMLRTKKGLNKIMKLMDWIVLTIYAFGSLLKVQNGHPLLLLYMIPVPFMVIIRLVCIRKKTSLLRIILWLQVLMLTLKVDKILHVSWLLIFAISFILSIGFTFRLFPLMYSIKQKKQLSMELAEESHQRLIKIKMLGVAWDLLINCFSVIFLLFFYGLSERLESENTNHLLEATLIIAMIYSILLIYISLKYKYEITRSIITKIIRNDSDHVKIKELLQKELEVGISNKSGPRQLVKVSSTYYQVAKTEMKTRPENKHKTTFVTVGDLAANGKEDDNDENDEEEKEEPEEGEQEGEEDEQQQEEEKDEEEEEEKEDNEGNKKNRKEISFRTKLKSVFRKRKNDQPSYSEPDAQQEEEEEETPENQIKSEENGQDDPNCFVCCDKLANTVIMNCGHAGLCYQCGLEMWKKEEKCYMCRQKITKLLRLDNIPENKGMAKVQMATTLNKNHKININESFQDILNEI